MKITEVRVKMVGDDSERLRAFCSVTIDDAFVIRDLKIIDGDDGPFVAMPSRKMSDHCAKCGEKNHLRARFCNECGIRLNVNRAPRDESGRVKLYADVAHPINVESREMIQEAVIAAFNEELALSLEPGYGQDDDVLEFVEDEETGFDSLIAELRRPKETSESDDVSCNERGRRDELQVESKAAGRRAASRDHSRQSPVRDQPTNRRASEAKAGIQKGESPMKDQGQVSGIRDNDDADDDFAAGLDWDTETVQHRADDAEIGDNGQRKGLESVQPESQDDFSVAACSSNPDSGVEDSRRTDVEPEPSKSVDADDEFGMGIF